MASVSVSIMAHPKRAGYIPDLLDRLDRPAEVVYDRHGDRWDTGRRSWEAIDRTASHGLVLQDDAVIPRDLIAGIERALQRPPPGSPLCLYLGRRRPFAEMVAGLVGAAGERASWIVMPLHWGVGIVLPTELIGPCMEWGDRHPEIANYDMRIGEWLRRERIPVWYPWPSLVDHRAAPSLVPGRGHANRQAHRFIGAEASALDFDPDGAVINATTEAETRLAIANPTGRRWRVIGHCAHASVTSSTGRAQQMFFRGAYLPADAPEAEIRHLLSVGLIAPVLPEEHP